MASARAIATRCCWPPESAAGSLSAWSRMPDALEELEGAGPTRLRRAARPRSPSAASRSRPWSASAAAGRTGTRCRPSRPRQRASSCSRQAVDGPVARPPSTSPVARRGRCPPIRWSSVDLPLAGLATKRDELPCADLEVRPRESAVNSPGRRGVASLLTPRAQSNHSPWCPRHGVRRHARVNATVNASFRRPFRLGCGYNGQAWRRRVRVLVVEDEPLLARQLAARPRHAGYAVDAAADGERADFLAHDRALRRRRARPRPAEGGRPDAAAAAGATRASRCRCSC